MRRQPTERCFFLLPLFLAASLAAHDLYILPGSFHVAAHSTLHIAFNNGDSFPASEAAPPLARLKDAEVRFSGGKVLAVHDLRIAEKQVVGDIDVPTGAGNLLISVHTTPNFIAMAPNKFLAYLKEEGLSGVIEWRIAHRETQKPSRERYSKFARSLIVAGKPDAVYQQSSGFPIEVIPERNPYSLHAGDSLPVRVFFRGQPAAGLQLEAAWTAERKSRTTIIGRTNAEGRIVVPLAAAGRWRLHSLMMERCADPAVADWESFWASLTFEIQ